MTAEGEDVRVPHQAQYPQQPQQPPMPRLFADAEDIAGEGDGGGDDGAGVASDGGTGASALPGGARPGADDAGWDDWEGEVGAGGDEFLVDDAERHRDAHRDPGRGEDISEPANDDGLPDPEDRAFLDGMRRAAERGTQRDAGRDSAAVTSLLDGDRGVRGAAPASRSELADLILRYRDEQAAQRSRRRVEAATKPRFTAEQRLLVLDSWLRSKLPAGDFAPLVGLSLHTLRAWKQRFLEHGPAGLDDKPQGRPTGSRLSEATRRAILLLKEQHPDWGQDRIAAVLLRAQGFTASASAIGRVLQEDGYVAAPDPSQAHGREPQRFERSRPNQLWQTDLFTFVLKRENRRVHMVAFLDDHSRFVVGYGLHASASGALVREALLSAIANFGLPQEVLTDNGPQYVTWRGKSEFAKTLEQRGIRQIVARPRHPETLGKVERFWGTLWRECVETAVFRGLDDARRRIGLFIDHYNFQRPHSGVDGLVPADRFFAAAPQVLQTLKDRVAKNAAELARDGTPRKPFYLTGRIGDQHISLHAEGEKVVLTQGDSREEVDLGATGPRCDDMGREAALPQMPQPALPTPLSPTGHPSDRASTVDTHESGPGESPLDAILPRLLGEEGAS